MTIELQDCDGTKIDTIQVPWTTPRECYQRVDPIPLPELEQDRFLPEMVSRTVRTFVFQHCVVTRFLTDKPFGPHGPTQTYPLDKYYVYREQPK